MKIKTLKERLKEIEQSGVPYILVSGNHLPGEFFPDEIVQNYGELPEVVKINYGRDFYKETCGAHKKEERDNQARVYASNLAKLSGRKPEEFLARHGSEDPLDLKNTEMHFIYNPKTDITYIFELPFKKQFT